MKSKSKPNALPKPERALPAAKWLPILDAAGLTPQILADAKTPHAKAIKLGQWLSAKVGRELPVSLGGQDGKAVLRVIGARANEKRYYFEVTWERAQHSKQLPHDKSGKSQLKQKKGQHGKSKTSAKTPGKHKRDGNNESW